MQDRQTRPCLETLLVVTIRGRGAPGIEGVQARDTTQHQALEGPAPETQVEPGARLPGLELESGLQHLPAMRRG